MGIQNNKKNCIYNNVNAKSSKKHKDGKMTGKEKIKKYVTKCLVDLKHKNTALNLEVEGKRHYGRFMSELSYEGEVLSYVYDGKKVKVKLSQIARVKRLRSQKYLFFVTKEATVDSREAPVDETPKKVVNKNKKTKIKEEV